MKKKGTHFYTWLNQTIFWKNNYVCKLTRSEKRVIETMGHKRSKRRY